MPWRLVVCSYSAIPVVSLYPECALRPEKCYTVNYKKIISSELLLNDQFTLNGVLALSLVEVLFKFFSKFGLSFCALSGNPKFQRADKIGQLSGGSLGLS